jgi:hypothetical protein
MSDNDINPDPQSIAKTYMDEHFPHMSDGNYYVKTHDPQHDMPFVNLLEGVDASHLDDDLYHVVTVSKNITLEDGVIMPFSVKLKVKGDQVSSVLTSKSFDASAV